LTTITLSNALTNIPDSAFLGCGATEVTIPNSVTSISVNAFYGAKMTTLIMSTSITSIGITAFQNCSNLTSITFPASLTTIGAAAFGSCKNLRNVVVNSQTIAGVFASTITNNVDLSVNFNYIGSIPASVCSSLTNLKNVTIGPNITRIFGSAFKNCSFLTSVAIPDSVTIIDPNAFENCYSMDTVTINDTSSLTTIGTYAFSNCSMMNSINIPSFVTTIGTFAFNNCNRMVTCTFSQNINLLTISDNAFMYSGLTSIVIPNSVRTIGTRAFSGCLKLTSATIPTAVTTMNVGAFASTGLTSVTVPNITTINIDTFRNCGNLTSVTIPNTVTIIESTAFWLCSKLTTITIPASVLTIRADSFNGTESLTSIVVDDTNPNFSSENGVLFNKNKTTLILYPPKSLNSSYVIPSTVTSIQAYAFWKCANLTSITIPNSVITIPDFAFNGLPSISSIVVDPSHPYFSSEDGVLFNKAKTTLMVYPSASVNNSYVIPSTVTFINAAAFSGSTNLTSVTIPNSVTRINDSTFSGCTNLTTATISSFVTTLILSAFNDCTSLTSIAIPASVTTIYINQFAGSLQNVANMVNNPSVPNMVVNASNPNYSSENGVLFNKTKTTLSFYPSLSTNISYVIPSTVSGITTGAFGKCANLTTLTIPSGIVTAISDFTFVHCPLLKTVVFNRVPTINPINFIDSGDTAAYAYDFTLNPTSFRNLHMFTNQIRQNIPTLTFSIPAKTFANAPFTITPPTSDISGVFTYTSSNTAVATVSGDVVTTVGIGNSDVKATLTCARNYGDGGSLTTSSETTKTLVVSKGLPTLSQFSIPAKTVGNAPFTLVPPTSNSTGAFTYTSSNTAVASITNAGVITIVGVGVTIINAYQAGTTNFLENSIDATFAVNATTATITPTITNFSVAPKALISVPFTLVPPTSDSSGAFSYISSNPEIAYISRYSVSSGQGVIKTVFIVTIVALGSTTITAVQEGNATYRSGSISSVFTVSLTEPTILSNFSVPAKTFGNSAFTITPPTTNSNGSITYTSSNPTVATIVGDVVTIVGGGTTTITASQIATTNFTSATIVAPLTVSQGTPTITDFSIVSKTVSDASFNITPPTSNSTGAFTYTSSDTSVAIVAGNAITIVGVGTSTITAVQASTANYLSGSTTALFQVDQGILTLSNFSVPEKSVGNADFTITPPTTNSTGAFTYTSSDQNVATIAGNVVTIVGVGSSTITASQESTANYTSATITASFTVGLAATITDFSVPEKTFGDASFNLIAPTTNSDGVITYTSSNTAVATIAGDVVTIVGGGTTTITALQAFTAVYGPTSIAASFVVSQASTVLTDFSVASKTFGDASFNLIAPTTNSTGLITYTSSDTSVATISGNVVTVVGAGTSTITANQASNASFLAQSIPATFTVNQATPTITNFVVPAKVTASEPFALIAPTSNSSGLYTYTSSNTSVATIAGDMVTIVGKGTATITADQESTANYLSGSIDGTLIVRFTPVITDFVVSEKTFGDVSFNLVPPTTDSDGTFTYTSSNTAVATIAGDVVTIVGAGSATITAVQSLTDNYIAGTITAPFVVNQATPVLTNFSVPEKTFLDASFNIIAPTTNSPGLITYTSSDTNVATVSGSRITIVGAGTSTITADQASTTNFLSGSIPATFIVNQAPPTMTNFVVPAKVTASAPFTLTAPTSNSSGLYTYSSSDTSVATIEGNVVTIVGKGTSTITATQESTANYLSGSITNTLIVRFTPVITYFAVSEKTFGDASFNLVPPTTDSDGTFTYTSSNTAVATIAGDVVTIVGAGSATITAVQALTGNYVAGTITAPFVVNKATTVLTDFSVPEKVFGNGPFSIVAPTTNSNGVFTYTSSDSNVATVTGSTITIVGAGTATITANQATANNFLAETIPTTFTVNKALPTYYYFNGSQKLVEDVSFTMVPPSSNSSGLYTYTSSDTSIATIEGDVVTILTKGTIIITATQESTANYLSGSVTATFVILLRTVMADFSVPGKTFGDAPFEIVAPTTNSNGAITYGSGNLEVATVNGNIITILRGGTTTITAYQASTSDYESKEITYDFVVTRATTILSNFSVPAKVFGNAPFAITPPTTNSNGVLTYTSSDSNVASVSGSTITIVAPGTATITANQANSQHYLANSIDTILTVGQATPTITNFSVPTKIIGNAAFNITAPTSNSPGAFTYTSSNEAVATIAGNTITIVGVGSATITADQATTTNYLAGTITANFQVNQITTVLTGFSVPAKQFANADFALVNPTTNNSIGALSFTSSNTAVATIVGNMVTIVGVGSSIITVNQESTTNYTSGTATATLTVSKATTVLSGFAVGAKTFGDASFNIVAPTTNGDGAFTYFSSNTAVATVSGSTITIVGAGTSTITANQATTTNYLAATTTATLTVAKAPAGLTNFSLPVKIIGNGPFAITPPTTNSTGALSYFSSNSSVATVAGTTITIAGIGTSTITANQATTANYLAGSITTVFQVNNVTPVITNFVVPAKTFGDAEFSLATPTSNSAGTFTYTSSNLAVATIVENVVTIVGGGTSIISAIQAATSSYVSGTATVTLTVSPATTVLSNFSVSANTFGNAPFSIVPPTSNSNGGFTYTSSNTNVATIVGDVVTMVGAGTSTITATQTNTASYTSSTITASFQVGQAMPTLSFSIPTKTILDAAYTIDPPTSNSTGAFTYTSSNTAVATIVDGLVTILALGTTTITAVQASTNNYLATTISATFRIIKATPTLSDFTMPVKNIGESTFLITPPTTDSDGLFTYTSSDSLVATISGNRVTIKGPGTSTITAIQATSPTYLSATIQTIFEVNQRTTVLSNFVLPAKTFGDIPYKIQAWSNSSGAITYSSSNPLVATIVGDMVTIVGAGTTDIMASQASWFQYDSASITETLTVNQITTVLTRFTVPEKRVGNESFALSPPFSNRTGLITYESSNTDVATIDGNLVTIVGAGSSTITATQVETTNSTSGTIDATLTVSPAIPTLTNFAVPAKSFGDASFTITPPTTNSTGLFTYRSSNLLVATVAEDVVTIVGSGSCTISAIQASTTNYISGTITAPFVVSKAVTTMADFSVPEKVFGNSAFTITPPTTNSNGAFTYESSNTSVATIFRNQIIIVGVGSSTISAVQPMMTNYLPGTISTTFTVGEGTPVLTNFVVPVKIVGDAAFAITPPRSNSDGLITYTSSDTAVATIDGNTITIVGRGTSTISANQASTTNFLSGTTATVFTVNRVTPLLTNFTIPEKTFGDDSFTVTPPTSNSDGLITYTSSDDEVATIDGNIITIVGGGNVTITANQASTESYGFGTIGALFRVNRIQTELSNFDVSVKIVGDPSFNLVAPTTNGNGTFTYESSDSDVATIEGDVVTIVGLGNSTITAIQSTTANYTSDRITALFQVKLIRTVLSNFVVPAKTIGDASFSLVPPTTNSEGSFTYTSSNQLVATVEGDVVTIVGTGNVTIRAVQASTPNSTTAQITASLLVNKSENAIDWFSVPEKAFGDAPFTIVPPTTISTGAFTYTSSNPAVATIVRNVVTIVGIGTSTITAVQAKTINYESGTITAILTVGQGTPTLTNFSVPTKIMGNANFSLVPPRSNSDGLFTYESSDFSVATVEGNVVTIVGVGTSIITATQTETTNYLSATSTATLTVNQITPVLTNFSVPAKTFGSETFTLVPPTTNSDGDFTYTSSDVTVASINGNVVTVVGAGNANITVTQEATANYKSATMTALFQVNPIRTVLTNFSVPAKIIGEGEFTLVPPTTASNSVFTYTSSNTEVATIDGDTVTIVGLGDSIITAIQPSTTNYTSARITALFQVNLIATVLTDFVVPAKTVGDEPFSLVPPTSNSNGAFTYTSSNLLVARIEGGVVTVIGVGTCAITAVQASTANSRGGRVIASFVVAQRSPTITNFVVAERSFGNAPFKLTPPTTNGVGAFTYTSSDTNVATINKDVVTIVGIGTSTITAVQSSTTNFASGTITTLFKVDPGTANLTNFVVPAKTFGITPFALIPPTSRNNTEITYTSSNQAVATIDGNTVTIVGAGTSTITASQASSATFLAGTITAILTVNPATTVLTNFSVGSKAFGIEPFALDPPTTSSDGAFTYTSSNTAVATIDGNIVTILKGGVSTITAVQASTTNYTSATITAVLQVSSLTTVLSGFNLPTRAVGNAPFVITPPTTNGDGAFTYTSSNTAIATIAGSTITIVGAGSVTITAIQASTGNYTSARITELFTVNKGTPEITNFTMPVREIGMPDFTITNPTSTSTGEFTYTSSNVKVATIFKNTVSIKGIGTATITASQAMSTNYIAGSVTVPFIVNQMSPTFSTPFVVPATKIIGDAKFKLIAPKSNSISPFVFTSSNTAVATIAKDMVTIVGAGTITISATQASTKSYGSRTVTGTMTVTAKPAVLINFSIARRIIGVAPFAIVPPTANSNGAITYTSSNENVATIAGNMLTVVGVGTSTITANQASTPIFTSGTTSTTLVVNLPTPQVSALLITNKSMTNPTFTIVDPTKPSDNTGTWTYTSTNATISGNEVTLLQPGIVTITAVLSSDSTYSSRVLMTQFSVSDLNIAPSSFVFIRSAEVETAIPTTVPALLNTVIPVAVSTPVNIARFNPKVGTVAEKQANQRMIVNTLLNMFPLAITVNVPTPLLDVPGSFNKTKLKTIKLVRPSTGTTNQAPLVINTIASDSAVGFLCSILDVGNSIRLNGLGTFATSFIQITRGANNSYSVIRSTKGVPVTSIATNGDIIPFVGMTAMIGY